MSSLDNKDYNEGAVDEFHRLKEASGKTYDEGVLVGKVLGTYDVLSAVNEVLHRLQEETR